MTDNLTELGKKKGKRTNGSKRKRVQRRANRQRWASEGVKVGSVNVAGMSVFKILLLL